MTQEELNERIRKHEQWLYGEEGGRRADLSYCDLTGLNMHGADLAKACLRQANMTSVILDGAGLLEADLSGVTLINASLNKCDLRKACLKGAKIHDTSMCGAILVDADLDNSDLINVDLSGSTLELSSLVSSALKNVCLKDSSLILGLVDDNYAAFKADETVISYTPKSTNLILNLAEDIKISWQEKSPSDESAQAASGEPD